MPTDDKKINSLEEQENYDVPVFVSPFFDSVKHRSVYNVELMIKHGAYDVNSRDGRGRTAGHLAAYRGDCNMLKMLLSYGLDLTIIDEWGEGKTVPQLIQELCASKPKMQQILDEHMERLKLQEKSGSEVIDASSSIGSAAPSRASSSSVKTLQTALLDSTLKHVEKPVKGDQLEASDRDSTNDKSGFTVKLGGSHAPGLS